MSNDASDTLTFKMTNKSSVQKKDAKGNTVTIGDVVLGTLDWGSDSYQVRSGPWGKGGLPAGTYTVDWAHLVEGSPLSAAKDFGAGFKFSSPTTLKTSTKLKDKQGKSAKQALTGFFVPIKADFDTKRGDLGIHPDGNVYGTQGCIGLVGDDAAKFWKKVLDTKPSARPKKLEVSGTPDISGEAVTITGDGSKD
jgi:hypothetical protein